MKKKILLILIIFPIFLSGCDKNSDNNSEQSKEIFFSETEIGKFATNIIDKTENRQSNIKLTCSKLNNFTVESGNVFSFLQMIGETSEKTRI